MIARAGENGELTPAQYDTLAPTCQKIVDFSIKYAGRTVADIMV